MTAMMKMMEKVVAQVESISVKVEELEQHKKEVPAGCLKLRSPEQRPRELCEVSCRHDIEDELPIVTFVFRCISGFYSANKIGKCSTYAGLFSEFWLKPQHNQLFRPD